MTQIRQSGGLRSGSQIEQGDGCSSSYVTSTAQVHTGRALLLGAQVSSTANSINPGVAKIYDGTGVAVADHVMTVAGECSSTKISTLQLEKPILMETGIYVANTSATSLVFYKKIA